MPGLWFEEREVGQIFRRAIRRTSTEADNVWFSALTHNPAVLHLDEECCRTETEFGRRIVNSAFTLGLMVGISGGDTALGATVANLGRDEVRFPRPLFHNDAPRVESEVLSKRERRSRPGQDVDEFIRRAFNHKGEPVAHCRRSAPMKGRPERPHPAWRKACKRGTVDAAEALRWTSPSAARWRTGCRPDAFHLQRRSGGARRAEPPGGKARLDAGPAGGALDHAGERQPLPARGRRPRRVPPGLHRGTTSEPRLEDPSAVAEVPPGQLPFEVYTHLYPSRYCQSDRLERFARRTFGDVPPGHGRVNAVCNWIRNHVDYVGGVSDASTSALDTFVQRAGVCRDFAHLAIALCRALGIPARYVSAYAWRLEPSDFHAAVEAWLQGPEGGAWYLFDPTRMSAPEGVVRIGVGRDASDTGPLVD